MCDEEHRLGRNGVQEIQQHDFFKNLDWENIRHKSSPYKPQLKSPIDCKRFDNFEEEEPFYPPEDRKNRKTRKDINFVGYTYKKDVEEQKLQLVAALKDTLTADYGNASQSTDIVASDEGPRKVP